MSDIPVMKRIGWAGFTDGKPFFEPTTDDYVGLGDAAISTAEVFKSKKQARKRFQDVRPVFIEEQQ